MKYEYLVVSVCSDYHDTENKLNKYARDGWRVCCSYCGGQWFVLEREFKEK